MLALLGAACVGDIGSGSDDPFNALFPSGSGAAAGSGTGGAGQNGGEGIAVAPSQIARLTRNEYERTVTEIFGSDTTAGIRFDYLPTDSKAGPFETNAALNVDDKAVEAYRSVAESIGETVAANPETLLGCEESATCIDAFVGEVGSRLFRRPLDEAETTSYRGLFDTIRQDGTLSDALRVTITAMLQSPRFLYRLEVGTATDEPDVRRLTGYELAARLSFFLWKEAPDQDLMTAAAAGDLDTAEGIEREARRMLEDPRADYAVTRFHLAWLGIADLERHALDTEAFPEFEALKYDMLAETEDFVLDAFHTDPTLETLLTAPYSFASPELAAFYGAEADEQGRIDLDPNERIGVLTQASFLTAHAKDPKTAAIHRGKAIREQFFCQGLPAPPPVDMVITPDPNATTREQIEEKTAAANCQACHALINPLGFLFENYDAIGRYRTEDRDKPVDASGAITNTDVDRELTGAIELAKALAESETVTACVSRQWLRFALGRDDGALDMGSIEAAATKAQDASGDLRELIVGLTTSEAFRHRRIPTPP